MTLPFDLSRHRITTVLGDSLVGRQFAETTASQQPVVYLDSAHNIDRPLENVTVVQPRTLKEALAFVMGALLNGLKDSLIVLDGVNALEPGKEGLAAKAGLWTSYLGDAPAVLVSGQFSASSPGIVSLLKLANCKMLVIWPGKGILPKALHFYSSLIVKDNGGGTFETIKVRAETLTPEAFASLP